MPQGKATALQGKTAMPRGKASLKRPSDTEVASAHPVKQTKKIMSRPATIATAPRATDEASGSKGVPDTKKTVVPIRKRRVPAIGVMVEASSVEAYESSPHGQADRDSLLEIVSRPKSHGHSPRVSLPK
jgi:hypothetical protein